MSNATKQFADAHAKMEQAMQGAQDKLDMVAIKKRVGSARAQVVQSSCFFGSILLKLKPVPSYDVQTMATDGTHMFYNPEYVSNQKGPLLQSDCAHEALHPAFCHHTRRGNRRFDWWNEACDYAINPILREAGFEMWDDGLLREDMVGLSAEQCFTILQTERGGNNAGQPDQPGQPNDSNDDNGEDESTANHPDAPRPADDGDQSEDGDQQGESQGDSGDESGDQGDGNGQDGGDDSGDSQGDSGQGGDSGDQQGDSGGAGQSQDGGNGHSQVPSFGGAGAILDAPAQSPSEVAEAEAEWKIAVQQAVNTHNAMNKDNPAGDLPGNLIRQIEDLCEPVANWRELLKAYFENLSKDDYTWSTPNRRHVGDGLYLPSLTSESMPPFLFIGDCSGSMPDKALAQMQSELQLIIDDLNPEFIDVIFHDTRITNETRFEEGDDFVLEHRGGGGTRFAPACKWIEESDEDYCVIVWFTDMETRDWDDCIVPDAPVLFIDWTGRHDDPHFGVDVIPMQDDWN